ncbi:MULTISPECIES: FAD/NAD(P)-binding protein [unclassified Kitasatospora]|uniref:FAD/NAD(P)-binding protein n=1 Tax=unclassified Kitasatospora TaxID=2633591 RepID=UPI0033EA30E6
MDKHAIIVGGGASGVTLFTQLATTPGIGAITVVDPNPIGLGTAFGTTDPLLLCNTSVDVTSIDPTGESDLLRYLAARGWPVHRDHFVPRYLVGQYCRERYLTYRRAAEQAGIRVRHHRARATSVGPDDGGGHTVTLDDGARLTGTDVFLCLGLDQPVVPELVRAHVGHPDLTAAPYPVGQLRRLPARARILVLGSKLAAIDAAIVLGQRGRHVVLSSPSGQLPAVRTRLTRPASSVLDLASWRQLTPDSPDFDREAARLVVSAVARAGSGAALRAQTSGATAPADRLAEELRLAESGQVPWQDAIAEIIDAINDSTAPWPADTRRTVLGRYRHVISRYISSIPVRNARLLLERLTEGTLTVAPRLPEAVTPAESGPGWLVRWADDRTEHIDHIVCAAGYHKPTLRRLPDRTLLLHSDPALAVTGTEPEISPGLRVCDPRTGEPERVWVLGAASHPRAAIVNYLNTAARQATGIATDLLWGAHDAPTPAIRVTDTIRVNDTIKANNTVKATVTATGRLV